jgi:hypothetical protein
MKRCIIQQPAGLGDIIFCQKIATEYVNHGYDVVWPVIPQYEWVGNYIKTPGVSFCKLTDTWYGSCETLDLESAGHFYHGISCMDAKYKMAGNLDYSDWSKYFNFRRNIQKEEQLKIQPMEYNLICKKFASPPDVRDIDIPIMNDLPTIEIEFISGFTPFDWCNIIEHATNLYFVDTCFTLIIEKLDVKAKEMILFSRNFGKENEVPTYIATRHLFSKPWKTVHTMEEYLKWVNSTHLI